MTDPGIVGVPQPGLTVHFLRLAAAVSERSAVSRAPVRVAINREGVPILNSVRRKNNPILCFK